MGRSWIDIAILAALLAGCTEPDATAPAPTVADAALIVPGERVGGFVIGRDTQDSVMGSDVLEARSDFAGKGLYFEFEQGAELTGVTVTSSEYATRHGVRVGTPAAEVEDRLGPPSDRVVSGPQGKLEIPMLVYNGIQFLVDDAGVVRAIRIGDL